MLFSQSLRKFIGHLTYFSNGVAKGKRLRRLNHQGEIGWGQTRQGLQFANDGDLDVALGGFLVGLRGAPLPFGPANSRY